MVDGDKGQSNSDSAESTREGDDVGTGDQRCKREEDMAAADRGTDDNDARRHDDDHKDQGGGRGERGTITMIPPQPPSTNAPMEPPGPSGMVARAQEMDGGVAWDHGRTRPNNGADNSTSEAVGEGDGAEGNAENGPPPPKRRKKKQFCRHEGCRNWMVRGGVCIRHGAPRREEPCRHPGCTNMRRRGGVCTRHGAFRGVRIPAKRDGPGVDETPQPDGATGGHASAVEKDDGASVPAPRAPGPGADEARPAVFRVYDDVAARLAAAARGEDASEKDFYRHALAWIVRKMDEEGFAPRAFDAAPLRESVKTFEDVRGRHAAARAAGISTSVHVYAMELRFFVEEFKASFSFPLVKHSRPVKREREADC